MGKRRLRVAVFLETFLSILLGSVLASGLWAQKEIGSTQDLPPPAGWKGRIEIKDGVRTVINPDQPLYGEFAFDLEKDLVIGDESDEHKTFYKGGMIQVDDQGCIYALDYDKSCIQKYDPSGPYLMTIGKRGQGPGELDGCFQFYVEGKGRVAALHSNMIHIEIFKPDGSFEKRILPPMMMEDFLVNPDDSLYAKVNSYSGSGTFDEEIVRIDPKGRTVWSSGRFPGILFMVKSGKAMAGTYHAYADDLFFSRIEDDRFVYAHSSEYKITEISTAGTVIQVIRKDEKPVSISREEKETDVEKLYRLFTKDGDRRFSKNDIRNNIPWPDHKPFFSGIQADDRSRLYVMRFKDPSLDEKPVDSDERRCDVFDRDGIFIYRMTLPFGFVSCIKNGFLYRTETDESAGIMRILRYRIRNYEKMQAR